MTPAVDTSGVQDGRQPTPPESLCAPMIQVGSDAADGVGTAGGSAARLGPFHVRGLLASGSMGVVYEAIDPRLGRSVAIKLLPPEVSLDHQRLQRLADEARTLATISHANVAAIHGLERVEPDGAAMLVLEFVPGPTLRERLAQGRMSIEEALRIGVQIASGLEAAHERRIIHRDLKPDNIKITPRGVAKILDFGIALRGAEGALPAAASGPRAEVSGTHGYISPEQYRLATVDRRADIFAFGCVLFECLTGKRCFRGVASEEVMLATLDDEPDWLLLPARTPRRIQELLARCLQKDPMQRLRDIGDARLELELAIERREWTASREAVRRIGPAAMAVGGLAVGGLVTAAAMTWAGSEGGAARHTTPINVVISEPGVGVCGSRYNTGLLAISPDGRRVVYASPRAGGGGSRLVLWESDRGGARELAADGVDAYDPCFSPDGRTVYFVGPGLRRTTGPGVTPIDVWSGQTVMKGLAWSGTDLICSPHATGGLVSVPLDGGRPVINLTVPDYVSGELSHRYPDPLPDGRQVLFTLKRRDTSTFDDADICVLDLRTGNWRRVLGGGSYARWSPSGHILYVCGGTLFAVPFDLRSCTVSGARVPVVEGVMHEPASGAAQFALAREAGTLAYMPGGPAEETKELCWLGPGGAVEPLGAPMRDYHSCVPSPSGDRIAALVSGASDAVFVHEMGRGALTRLTFGGNATAPAWTPDSRYIIYASDSSGAWCLYQTPADGGGTHEKLLDLPRPPDAAAIGSAEGASFAVLEIAGALHQVRLDDPPEARRLTPITASGEFERSPAISPDGRWLAYSARVNGREDVWVRPFGPAAGKARCISDEGGVMPHWTRDGSGLVFARPGGTAPVTLWTVDGADLGGPGAVKPRPVMDVPRDVRPTSLSSPDDRRVLVLRDVPPTYRADRVCLILNFVEHLRQHVTRAEIPR